MRGKFITFEGPEGSGKTTQLLLLQKYLKENGVAVISTREPGGTETSEKLRNIILDSANLHISDRTELLLILSSRAQNTEEIILPALKEGKVVLCDRYSDSTLAYQSFGRGFDLDTVKEMCVFSSGGLKPDLTFLIDIDPALGLDRAKLSAKIKTARGDHDRMESQGLAFHRKVREGFLKLANAEPERFRVLDGKEPIEKIHSEIVKLTTEILKVR